MGVFQGTILGPLLFVIIVNDIFEIKLEGLKYAFADDNVALYPDQNWSKVQQNLQLCIRKIKEWLYSNIFSINVKKSVRQLYR